VPTILELANESGLSAEQVLRVVNGEPVSEEAGRRVRAAMERLGRPAYPPPSAPLAASVVEAGITPPPGAALERLADVAAEVESSLPAEVGTVVYEALRVEVRPVAEHVAGLETLLDGLVHELGRLRQEVAAERRDRVEDLALQVDLLRASWAGVDRRLGRIERTLARGEERPVSERSLSRIEERRPAEVSPVNEGNGRGSNGTNA
jgi:hypothetical protein